MLLIKLKQILTSALAALLTTAALATTSLAEGSYKNYGWGDIGNPAVAVTQGEYPYQYHGTDHLSWRVDLYVSSAEDGKIDKSRDRILIGADKATNDYLQHVGSILYTNADQNNTLLLQTNYTAPLKKNGIHTVSREQVWHGGAGGGFTWEPKYNLPTCKAIDASFKDVTAPDGKTLYIEFDPTLNGLPQSLTGAANYETAIQKIAESNDFITTVTDDISGKMGDFNFYMKIRDSVSKQIWAKADALADEKGFTDAMMALMPDSVVHTGVDPLVEWAVVITPMMQWEAVKERSDSFWLYYDDYGEFTGYFPHSEDKDAYLIMDAYYSATYNSVTTGEAGYNSIWCSTGLLGTIIDGGGYIAESMIEEYWVEGVLRRWYETSKFNILKDIGTIAYINEPGPIIGLNDWLNQTSYTDDQIARYGGITINIMENGGIPVHYHITSGTSDPPIGHSNPDEIISMTYTPEPNKPFIPEIPDGVEDGVIKQVVGLVDPTDDPHPYPDPKDPTSTVDDDDPFEVDTDPDDEPGNDDDIEEIHVWITEDPGVPVYLHTYIFEEADLADVDIDNPAEVLLTA